MDLDVALPFETDVVLPDGPVATRSRSDGPRDPEGRAEPAVEVRRSARRRRTVSAYREGDRVIVLVPARFSRAEERRWVQTMLERLAASEAKRRPSDACTPSDRSIRISSRVQGMPGYVLDYVILHELSHLLVAGHGPDFWALLAAYPRLERARGYLDGVAAASGLALSDE